MTAAPLRIAIAAVPPIVIAVRHPIVIAAVLRVVIAVPPHTAIAVPPHTAIAAAVARRITGQGVTAVCLTVPCHSIIHQVNQPTLNPCP